MNDIITFLSRWTRTHVVIEHRRFGFDCSVLASERQCSFVAFRRYAGRIWIGGPSFAIGLRYPGPWRFCSRIRGSHTGFRSTATPVFPQQPWYSERGCQSGCEFRYNNFVVIRVYRMLFVYARWMRRFRITYNYYYIRISNPGINPASAAWWTMASHLAAQDYLARLQGAAGLPGFPPGAESLLPPYPASLLNPPSLSSHKSSKCKYLSLFSLSVKG